MDIAQAYIGAFMAATLINPLSPEDYPLILNSLFQYAKQVAAIYPHDQSILKTYCANGLVFYDSLDSNIRNGAEFKCLNEMRQIDKPDINKQRATIGNGCR